MSFSLQRAPFPATRMRRLRAREATRRLVRENRLDVSDLILPLFVLTLLVAVFYTFTIVANLIAAPFNSLLSSSIEAKPKGLCNRRFLRRVGCRRWTVSRRRGPVPDSWRRNRG